MSDCRSTQLFRAWSESKEHLRCQRVAISRRSNSAARSKGEVIERPNFDKCFQPLNGPNPAQVRKTAGSSSPPSVVIV